MKNKDSVELIEYTKAQDALNCVTHALGAIFGAAVLILLIKRQRRLAARDIWLRLLSTDFRLFCSTARRQSITACRRAKQSGQPVLSITPLYRFCSPHGDPVLAHNAL